MSLISVRDLEKHFRVVHHRAGLVGTFKDLFAPEHRIVRAVDGISFSIEEGEIVGYIGPNGAGKSTTLKMMTGILEPSAGQVLVDGLIPHENRQTNARKIGVVFGQRSQLWWDLPVIESFHILREIYSIEESAFEERMAMLEDLVALGRLHRKAVRSLSLGQRMLCDIAACFLHRPRLVFLDEPTIGLDVATKARIRELIRAVNRLDGTTVILTTHDMSDVEALCSRVVIIDKGRKIYDDRTEGVRKLFGSYRTLKVRTRDAAEQIAGRLEEELRPRLNGSGRLVVESLGPESLGPESLGAGRDPEWVGITFDEDRVALLEILERVMVGAAVQDIRVEEVSTESVVREIYRRAER